MESGAESLRWGILAPGKIARSFAADLAVTPGMSVAAAGSRRLDSARAFTEEYGGTPYGSYAELVADPAVDVVYVASPHALHAEHTRLALDAGKPVLCEKPLTLDADSARELFAHAADRGLFLMEAMWTACHPRIRAMLERLHSGDFGTPSQVVADLGFVVHADPSSRLLDPAMGAGALLDMGIYPLTLAHLVLGPAQERRALANVINGIDLDVAVLAKHDGGALSASTATMTAASPRTATVATDRGRIALEADFHHPEHVRWTPYDAADRPEEIEPVEPVYGQGYGNEALEVARCLAAGLTESTLVPHEHTIALLHEMDLIREQIGVEYRE